MKNDWIKKGLIYKPTGEFSWSKTHSQVPFAHILNKDTIRFFFATRDELSQSSVGFIDSDIENPEKIKHISSQPSFQKGSPGRFDDTGTMPSWFLNHQDKLYLFYTAWNKSETASYRLSIGIAESTDNGISFNRLFNGPILDRSIHDPIWVGQPCVMIENGTWRMWYLSCEKIEYINEHPEPFYNVKYAESKNGILWERKNKICIGFDFFIDAIGRPCVYKENGIYKMLYSYRNAHGYRNDPTKSYRIGYAESNDGIDWVRKDEMIDLKKNATDWESVMQEYCTTYVHKDKRYLVYNGNGFGQSGFGYAVQNRAK